MPRGREKKTGQSGLATQYISRDRALLKMQVNLKVFRKLCILKGVYPRVPPNTVKKKNKTYFHVKDIKYLMHDPIVPQIRKYKTFMKRLTKYRGRKDKVRVKNLLSNKPKYNFDHMVKERYPTFVDAVKDLDDALCMIFLFASLPSNYLLKEHMILKCQSLRDQWNAYVIRTRSIRKAFCSIKGIYFQASIMGQPCTWVVPYPYTPNVPNDIDFRIMLTFLEFHIRHLEFVLFRLYYQIGLSYPPVLQKGLSALGATILALQFKKATVGKDGIVQYEAKDEVDADEEEVGAPEKMTEEQVNELQEKVNKIASMLRNMGVEPEAFDDEEDDDNREAEKLDAEINEFRKLAAKEGEVLDVAFADPQPGLFRGLVFFLGRENLRDPLFLILASCGAEVGWEGPDSPFDINSERITHVIVDRPVVADKRVDREYVQPQWVFDSLNFAFLLAPNEYMPGVELPPHLSPFVDDEAEGYIPDRKKEILAYIDKCKGIELAKEDEEEKDVEEDPRDAEDYYQEGLAVEVGKMPKESANAAERAKKRRDHNERRKANAAVEAQDLQAGVFKKKDREALTAILRKKKEKDLRAKRLTKRAESAKEQKRAKRGE